ncbi:MAG TPA: GNAT family N-acetyltransferase [Beutenbergiaceae bacterium]|nr:GNAT family N-acetyltransferase [Beutenbergiaceae bacterium]
MTVARIRPAHGGDAQTIHELHLACWQEAYTEFLPQSAFDDLQASGLAHWQQALVQPEGIWIAGRDGQAVGFARAIAAGPGQARPLELEKLYVRASEYGQGTAHNLMHMAIGDAPCQIWVADYNVRARRFYTKAGFVLDSAPGSRQEASTVPGVMLHRMIR